MHNILIGIASGDTVKSDFAGSLSALCIYSTFRLIQNKYSYNGKRAAWQLIGTIFEKGPTGHRNRHRLAQKAIRMADKILFLDGDMVYPQNILIELLSADKHIIGCNATTRSTPIRALALDFDGKIIEKGKGLSKVKMIPSGCLMVDTNVFKKMNKPYFDTTYAEKKDEWIGLDYYFSANAAALGFDLWCHHTISPEIKHIGEAYFSL